MVHMPVATWQVSKEGVQQPLIPGLMQLLAAVQEHMSAYVFWHLGKLNRLLQCHMHHS